MTENHPSSAALTLPNLRVCIFESRKSAELQGLLQRQGLSRITVAPSLRELPLSENTAAFRFAERLFAGTLDQVIFLTGVGTRALAEAVDSRHARQDFLEALQRCTLIVRGPKPAAVLREWKVRIDHQVPEPNTWRDLLVLLDQRAPVSGQRVAVQEYGQPNAELYAALAERGAEVLPVPIYRWALPADTRPLEAAIRATVAGEFDILVFTSAQQLRHVQDVAAQLGLLSAWTAAARNCVLASIGPTASETIRDAGFQVDVEPFHPKMGHLAQSIASGALAVLQKKRES